jgi:hypothetical protein
LWIRLKSVAVPEFARLNTGGSITRGNSGNGVLLTRENRAAREQKSRNGKAFAAGANAFQTRLGASHPQGRSTSQLYGLFTTACGAGLLTSSCALTFWICDACSSRRAVSCAIVAPKSAVVAGANAKAGSQIEKPGCVANALSITRFPRWRARSRKAEVVRAPAA